MGLGELCALLSAATWSYGVILYTRLGANVPPLALNFFKNLLVLLMVVPAVAITQRLTWPDFTTQQVVVSLVSGMRRASARSIVAVMLLAAAVGTTVRVETDGPDEQAAMTAIVSLLSDGLERRV